MKNRSELNVMLNLIGLVKPLTAYMILAIIMGLIGNLCASFITILGGYGILNAIGFNTFLSLKTIFILVCVFAVSRGILRYAEQTCNHFIAFKLLALIRDKVFKALRKLAPAKLECKDKGNLISVITSDIELLEVFYAHTISPIAIAILFSVAMTIFIGKINILLGIITLLGYIVVGMIIPAVVSKLSGDTGINFRNKSGDLSSFVLDSMRGLSETLQYDQGEERLSEINKKTDGLAKDEYKLKKNAGYNMAITNTIILIFDLVMLLVSVIIYQKGIIGFEGVAISTIAMMSSFGPCVALANLGSTLQNTFAAGNRVLDILDEEPVTKDITDEDNIEFVDAEAKNLTFAYDGEDILKDVFIEIPKHKITGIVGKSGSGKTTLLKLFMRFWQVQEGEINISGKNINEINTTNLRNMESYVTQETHLFCDTIKNNIKIAKLDATDDEIVEACKKASVHKFIESLPYGYDTSVSELGDSLSGGERQRIGLARAFLHNAPFILLDEPTSNLDSLNEAVILKALKEETKEKTVMLISHRASTMRIADKFYNVENGRMS